MLQAIIQHKARTFFSGHTRVPREDIVTSCVFGPLKYMLPRHAGAFLSWMLSDPRLDGSCVEEIQLWPRLPRDVASDVQREPDAVIRLKKKNGNFLLCIVEVKWDGPGLSHHQALDQWRQFGRPSINECTEVVHLFVVKATSDAAEVLRRETTELNGGGQQQWHKAQVILSWYDVAARLSRVRWKYPGMTPAENLASDVVRLLRELGNKPFNGVTEPRNICISSTDVIFFS